MITDFFSSVFTLEDCDNFPKFDYVTNCKLSNILCNTKEVEKLLKNLNIYKSPGPDSLPSRILKECTSVSSSPLCFFFNKSFSTGKLSHLWKLANITPLFKKGSKTDRNNYRQISLTSIVCKIAEKIVKSRVMDFWRNINILNPNQFAYMKGRSTLSELRILLRQTNYVRPVILLWGCLSPINATIIFCGTFFVVILKDK